MLLLLPVPLAKKVMLRNTIFFTFLILALFVAMMPLHVIAEDYWTKNNCVLEPPKSRFNNGSFTLDKERGSAFERAQMNDSIAVSAESAGCEYSGITYTFYIKEKPVDIGIIGAEYRKAITLLSLLEKHMKADFAEEKNTLQNYLNLVANPKLKEELYIRQPHDQFYEKIWIDADLDKNPSKVIIRISRGPY